MSNLVDHAKKELEIAGLFDKDSDYNGMFADAVIELIEVFSKQGHSGFSSSIVSGLFYKLSKFQTITPLTGEDNEWTEVNKEITNGREILQNNRNGSVFKDGKDGTPYCVDAIVWRTQSGFTFTGGGVDNIGSAHNIKSFPFLPKTFYIDIIEEKVAEDDIIYYIKNKEDLNEVWEYYDKKINE